MKRRLLTYAMSFGVGLFVWMGFAVVEALNPFVPWQYPLLGFFTGWTYPGGAPARLYYLSHVAETWLPFLAAYFTAYLMTKRQARFVGALILYATFLVWSFGMLFLAELGVPISIVFNIGLLGTVMGGAFGYLKLVYPKYSLE